MRKQYSHPPLKEVICEIQFTPRERTKEETILQFCDKMKLNYPNQEEGKGIETTLGTKGDEFTQNIQIHKLYRLKKDREPYIVQVSNHTLIINHQAPYQRWEVLRGKIIEALQVYMETVAPQEIERLRLRYINEISLPGEVLNLKKLFYFYPSLSSRKEEPFFDFIIGTKHFFREEKDILKLQLFNQRKNIVFDLDYYLAKIASVPLEEVDEWLEHAHNKIIHFFESNITDELRQTFGEVKGNDNG